MIQKKICMLGTFAVGKTSLVARFVTSIFSEKYLATIGVKIDKKTMTASGMDVTLILWDIHGENEFERTRLSYLRGASGYILVADGTRRSTLDRAMVIQRDAEQAVGKVPFVVALNKADLAGGWELDEGVTESLRGRGWLVFKTSARTGSGVPDVFQTLAEKMLGA